MYGRHFVDYVSAHAMTLGSSVGGATNGQHCRRTYYDSITYVNSMFCRMACSTTRCTSRHIGSKFQIQIDTFFTTDMLDIQLEPVLLLTCIDMSTPHCCWSVCTRNCVQNSTQGMYRTCYNKLRLITLNTVEHVYDNYTVKIHYSLLRPYRPIAWWRHIRILPYTSVWPPLWWGSEMYYGDWEKGVNRIVAHQCKWLLQRNYIQYL